jgi:hypothetical protein
MDAKVLHHGPFEFRVLSGVPPHYKSHFAKPFREMVGWKEEEVTREPMDEEKKEDGDVWKSFAQFFFNKKAKYSPLFKVERLPSCSFFFHLFHID